MCHNHSHATARTLDVYDGLDEGPFGVVELTKPLTLELEDGWRLVLKSGTSFVVPPWSVEGLYRSASRATVARSASMSDVTVKAEPDTEVPDPK